MGWLGKLFLLPVIVAVAMYVLAPHAVVTQLNQLLRVPTLDPSRYPFPVLPVLQWTFPSESEDVANRVAAEGQPALLRAASVAQWKALQAWSDAAHMQRMVPRLPRVGSHHKNKFLYFHDRPLANLTGVTELRKKAPTQKEMELGDFYRRVFGDQGEGASGGQVGKKKGYYYYYADSLFALNPELLMDILPFNQLLVKEDSNPEPNQHQPQKMLVWMGSANVTTHLHYDWSHNIHVVVYGKKSFMLFPPSDWDNLYLYPFLHPYGTKAQVDIEKPDLKAFPKLAQATGYEVTVNAGEALYIPPLWFHQVKAVESSISVSVWSRCGETALFDESVALGVPFDKEWSKKQMVLASILFTEKLFIALEELEDQEPHSAETASWLDTAKNWWKTAVQGLFSATTESVAEPPTAATRARTLIRKLLFSRYQNLRGKVEEVRGWSLCPTQSEATSADARMLVMEFSDAVENMAFLLASIPVPRREIWLGDYVEILANLVVSPDEIVPYMGCLRALLKPL